MSTTNQTTERAKGRIFENVVKKLLEKNEYEPCKVDNEQVDDKGRVRGRGEWHQIDALGRWKYTIPFVYPIRLLCEAKCWNNPIGLPIVRNYVGVVKDIEENYFVEDNQDIDKRMLSKRHTDCGAIFSTSGFTKPAQRYAYAQRIFLVSYENNPVINELKSRVDEISRSVNLPGKLKRKEFSDWFEEAWSSGYSSSPNRYITNERAFSNSLGSLKGEFLKVKTSVVGVATGVYPLHLLSYQEIPHELFSGTDGAFFRITYRRTESGGHYFEIYPSDLPNIRFYFTVPELILSKYMDSLRRFKKEFLEWIDIPVTLGRIRRILRFNLDREWLQRIG